MAILDYLRGLLGAKEPPPRAPDGGPPAAIPTAEEPLNSVTVAALRAMLDEHDRGVFLRSALLSDLLRRDADVAGALQQRLLAFQGLEAEVEPVDDTPAAAAAAEGYDAARCGIVSSAAQLDMALDACMMGFGLGQLVPVWDEAAQRVTRVLDPWPASAVEHDRATSTWYALTQDQGRLAVTPGDGQWVLFTPRGCKRPWLWGAVRQTAEWYVRSADAAYDASRHAEVFGSAIWKAKIPTGGRETPEGKTFTRGLRTMGRGGVVPCPQGGDPKSSYDVELVEAKADAHAIFEFLMKVGGGKIRLAILGQDLTSQNNTVGTNASSGTGLTVLDRVVRADGIAWGECEAAQIAAPRAAYLGEPRVRVCLEGEEEDRRKADADALKAAGDALDALQRAGLVVDRAAFAARFGVPLAVLPGAPPNLPASSGDGESSGST